MRRNSINRDELVTNTIREFGGKLVGKNSMKNMVAQTLTLLPKGIRDYIIKNCWFLSSARDAYGYTFSGNDLKNKHLIFLSDELLDLREEQIQYTVLHEIGHVILRHRNAINYSQTKKEIKRQEKEADIFARKYLA